MNNSHTSGGAFYRAPVKRLQLLQFVFLLLLLLIAAPLKAQPTPPATPVRAFAAQGITVELYQESIAQARAGLIRVRAEGLTDAEGTFLLGDVPFFAIPGDSDRLYGLLATGFETPIRTHELIVTVTLATGERRAVSVPIEVTSGGFLRQDVTLREDQLALIDPQTETDEMTLLAALTQGITPNRLWSVDGFVFPTDSELTSPFGAVRMFNETFETRHTGWDFNGGLGDLTAAIGDGRVVYAGPMDIRGNYVLIDHGVGVYSGYAHLSVTHVVAGQFVRAGQIIGLAGTTGRSSSPHHHLEMKVNGQWVDPVDFINMWVP